MTTVCALGASLFGAAILLFVLNDYRLHRRDYDWREVLLFLAIGAGGVCSLATGLKVML